jgi:hypothetical protein
MDEAKQPTAKQARREPKDAATVIGIEGVDLPLPAPKGARPRGALEVRVGATPASERQRSR